MKKTVEIKIADRIHDVAVKEYKGHRVVTFKDIDELHQRPDGTASRNFRENRKHFIEEEDYFDLTPDKIQPDEIRRFGIDSPRGGIIVTESGYTLLVKSFTDDLAWEVQRKVVKGYFRGKKIMEDLSNLSPELQFMIKMELDHNELKEEVATLHQGLDTLTDNLTAVPDPAKVRDMINEYQRWTRLDHNEIYNRIYDILLEQHGIDVPRRVQNERNRINAEYNRQTGKNYAERTLKKKVTGIDVMVRMGVLDKFHVILVGLLARAKGERKL